MKIANYFIGLYEDIQEKFPSASPETSIVRAAAADYVTDFHTFSTLLDMTETMSS